jgi:hypothetical protein
VVRWNFLKISIIFYGGIDWENKWMGDDDGWCFGCGNGAPTSTYPWTDRVGNDVD